MASACLCASKVCPSPCIVKSAHSDRRPRGIATRDESIAIRLHNKIHFSREEITLVVEVLGRFELSSAQMVNYASL